MRPETAVAARLDVLGVDQTVPMWPVAAFSALRSVTPDGASIWWVWVGGVWW